MEDAMQTTLLATHVLHILSGVFWAGSTFALARSPSARADELFRPQMGAAIVTVVTGGVLWHLMHPSGFRIQEQILALGTASALLAAGAQGALCGRALQQLAGTSGSDTRLQGRVHLGQRIAAGLLALTVICMAAARYV